MTRQADEKQYPGKRAKNGNGTREAATNFIPFHPTNAEKEAIKAMDVSEAELIGMLGALVDRGLTVKITTNRDHTAYCAVVMEAGQVFGQGTALSCFHASVFTVLRMVMYMLTTKWPNFPEQPVTVTQAEFDW